MSLTETQPDQTMSASSWTTSTRSPLCWFAACHLKVLSVCLFFFSFHISVCSKCSHPFTCLLDQSSEVKMGNPLLVLLQSPFQLLSHLHFDRQVSPDRYNSRLHPFSINYHTFVAVYFWNIFWVIVKYSGGQRPVTVE